jgi:hypothetical protein
MKDYSMFTSYDLIMFKFESLEDATLFKLTWC